MQRIFLLISVLTQVNSIYLVIAIRQLAEKQSRPRLPRDAPSGASLAMTLNCVSHAIFLYLIIFILNSQFSILNLSPRSAGAQVMSSKNFQIQGGNFNMTSGAETSTNFKLADVVGDLAAGNFATKGYHHQTGFQNIAAGSDISFSISPVLLDFGSLTPNNPVERQIFLKISNGKVPGYTVKVAQNHQLTSLSQTTIPDTVCDNPQIPCTQTRANLWQQNSSYGWGYRVSGSTVLKDFDSIPVVAQFAKNFEQMERTNGYTVRNLIAFRYNFAYRPFASLSRNDSPVLIMESSRENTTDEAVMTVKVNVDHNQPVGMYENVIIFTALAGI